MEIAEKVWDITFDTGTNVVDVYISILRKKIDRDFEEKLIHTKVGLGYYMDEPVMEIRKKLLYQFIGIVAMILLLSSLSVYISFSGGRKEEFYDRLGSKAKMVAQMLIDIDEIDAELLKRIEKNNPVSLPNEKIIIYDYQDKIVYSTDDDHLSVYLAGIDN